MVFKLQLFIIFSFLYLILKSHLKIHVGKKPITNYFSFFWMPNKVIYVSPYFLTLVSSKTNSHIDNPLEWWVVFTIANWVENKILVIKND